MIPRRNRMKKRSLLLILSLLLLLGGLAFVLPAPSSAVQSPTERVELRASKAAERQTDELSNIKARADKMIADRIVSLQKLTTRIQNDKRLTDSDKTSLTNDVNATIANLNTLKSKIDADTDVTTARADTKSIVTSYRIYVIYEPKVRLLITINNLQTTSTNMTTLAGKIQTLINDLKGQGKDVTSLQTSLDDMNTQLTTINNLLATDKTLVSNVNASTSNPQSVFTQVRKDLATVRADFAKVRHDIASMRDTLKIVIPKGTATIKPTGGASESAK